MGSHTGDTSTALGYPGTSFRSLTETSSSKVDDQAIIAEQFPQRIYGAWYKLSDHNERKSIELNLKLAWDPHVRNFTISGVGSVSEVASNFKMEGFIKIKKTLGLEVSIDFHDQNGKLYRIKAAIPSLPLAAVGKKVEGDMFSCGVLIGRVDLDIDLNHLKAVYASAKSKIIRYL